MKKQRWYPAGGEVRGLGLRRNRVLRIGEPRRRWSLARFAALLVLAAAITGGGAVHSFSAGCAARAADEPPNAPPGAADREKEGKPESWEISRIYDPAWLRRHLMYHERLPQPIAIPAIDGMVVDEAGAPVAGADIRSHTPRQWTKLFQPGVLTPSPDLPYTRTDEQGKFALPKRKELYRVLVAHKTGVASMSHEELVNAGGRIVLQPWSRIEGTFTLDGKPQADKLIKLCVDTISWSYSSGGPRVTTEYETKTDDQGHFVFDGVPPLPGRAHHWDNGLGHGARYTCKPGVTAQVHIGQGRTVTGQLVGRGEEAGADDKLTGVTVRHDLPDPPYPDELVEPRDQEALDKWRREWLKTAAGQAFTDEQNELINLNYPGHVDPNGTFRVFGVPEGRFKLVLSLFRTNRRIVTAAEFVIDSADGPPIDLGDVPLGESRPAQGKR